MSWFYPNRFDGKVMLLTGSSRGIGKSVAYRAAKEGAKLVLVDKIKGEGEIVLKEILDSGGDAIFLDLDLSKEESSKMMVEKAIEKYGKLDIAINNAGVMGKPRPVHELPKENMDFTMMNNFYSVFFSCKYEINQFIKQGNGGVILNNASIAGLTGLPGNPAYVASKHAVTGLTKNLALDYAKYGIRINTVNPSGTTTPMVEEALEYVKKSMKEAMAAGISPEKIQTMAGQKQKNMMEREFTPEEQAAVILFMVSEESSCMTGALVQTDGGWTSF
nr:SDR family oxidoreductase [Clostridioides difficile]